LRFTSPFCHRYYKKTFQFSTTSFFRASRAALPSSPFSSVSHVFPPTNLFLLRRFDTLLRFFLTSPPYVPFCPLVFFPPHFSRQPVLVAHFLWSFRFTLDPPRIPPDKHRPPAPFGKSCSRRAPVVDNMASWRGFGHPQIFFPNAFSLSLFFFLPPPGTLPLKITRYWRLQLFALSPTPVGVNGRRWGYFSEEPQLPHLDFFFFSFLFVGLALIKGRPLLPQRDSQWSHCFFPPPFDPDSSWSEWATPVPNRCGWLHPAFHALSPNFPPEVRPFCHKGGLLVLNFIFRSAPPPSSLPPLPRVFKLGEVSLPAL